MAGRPRTRERIAAAVAAAEAGDQATVRANLRRSHAHKRADPAFMAAAWAAYCDVQTTTSIIEATGCNLATAQACIDDGGPSCPPFRQRWADIMAQVRANQDAEQVDAITEGTRGLESIGRTVARMGKRAEQEAAEATEAGKTFAEMCGMLPPEALHKLGTTLDKTLAHLRAVKDGRQPGETPLEAVLGQAFSGLLGSVMQAAQAASMPGAARPAELAPAIEVDDRPAEAPDGSASVPQDASEASPPPNDPFEAPEAQEGAKPPKRAWQMRQEAWDAQIVEDLVAASRGEGE